MSESRAHFIRISKLFLKYKMKMIIAIFCMIIAALCTGFHAWLVKPALDQVLVNANEFYLYLNSGFDLVIGIRNVFPRFSEKIFNIYCKKKFNLEDVLCGHTIHLLN